MHEPQTEHRIYPSEGLKPLRVVSFWDGRRGHEKQTRGVLNALAGLTVIEEAPQTVVSLSGARRLRAWLSFCAALIRPGDSERGANPPDLIIGTGSVVHIPMLLLKSKYPKARAVACMTPVFAFRGRMDLCFVPHHDRPKRRDNMFETIGPPNNLVYADAHDPRRELILVGGLDPRSHRWDGGMLIDQVQSLVERGRDRDWTIATSPRTPPETLLKLENWAVRREKVKVYSSQNTPAGWIEQQYMQNRTVWVTADSVSMVYEALTAGCRVGILPVCWRRKNNKFQQGLDFLATRGYVTPFDTWLRAGQVAAADVRLDEASRCAREMLRRWWPNRLQ